MVRKSVKKLIAFALATVVTATSITPSTLTNVWAAVNVDEGNPFGGQNVALGKSVTVTAPEVADYQDGYSVPALTDGNTTGNWESLKNYPQDQVVYDYPMDIDVDLQGSYLLDHIKVYWQDIIAPGAYEVQISANKTEWKTIGEESEKVTGVESKSYTFDPQWVSYVRLACTKTSAYNCYGIREIEAYTIGGLKADSAEKENLALNNGETEFPQAVVYKEQASDASEFTASHLNDGNETTRWATGESTTGDDGQYITEDLTPWCYIDLGEEKTFNEIRLLWEGAYASSYTIAVATDSEAVAEANIRAEGDESLWTTIGTYTNTATGWQTQTIEDITARYVRILAKTLQLEQYGMSIYEMEVNYCPPVSVEKIYLSQKNEIIFDTIGDTVKLYAQVLPGNAENAEITWTSSNPDVATVADGLVTAIGNGTATITASTSNGVETSVNVMLLTKLDTPTVTAEKADGENQIDVSWTEISGSTYEIYRIVDGVQESDAITADTNSYTDTNVVAGSKYAYKVRAVQKAGETYSAIGDWSAESAPITIALAVDGVTLDKETAELTIETGKAIPTLNLKATVTPDKATNKNVTWNSDNEKAATVDASGKVTAVAAGKATITVTTEENSKTASCIVTVKEQLAAPAVTAEKTGAQEITLTWQTVENADTYQIYRAAGKNGTFEALTVNKEDITVTDGTASYTDTIDEDEVGNVYSYKVTAVPAGESYYIQSNESAQTALIQIGKSNPFGMNVAEGKEAEVSSTGTGTAALITNGVSDDLNEFWESAGNPDVPDVPDNQGTVDEYVTIDLKDTYDIDRVKIYWRPATPASIYTISVAGEDEEYEVIQSYDTRPAGDLTDCIFDHVSEAVRYVKVSMTQAQSYGKCGIRELEIYTQGTVETDDAVLSGILISQANEVLKKGEKLDLYAQVLPANAEAVVTWTSDSEAAIVAGGKVTAVSAGVATITATAGDFSKTCTVVVTDKLAAPTDVTAELEETEEKSVNVSWTASSDAAAYNIYRTVDGVASRIAEDVEGTTFTDETVEAGKTYSYQIVAVNPALSSAEEDAIALYEDSDKSESSNEVTIPIHVTGVTLNKTEAGLTILPGEEAPTVTLAATIEPAAATMKDVTWTSDKPAVATVSENGVVTAVAVGTATITAKTKDEKSTASAACTITVTEKLAAPTVTAELAEDETAITVTVTGVDKADTYTLLKSVNNGAYEEVSEAELSNETLTYTDEDITAGNSYSYKVKAVSATPEVYLTSEESDATDAVVVPIHVESITLNKVKETLTILPEADKPTVELTATVNPEDATTKDVTWTSDKPEVATVDENGVVTAVAVGTATITAKTKDEKSAASATCEITVVQKLDTPEITAVKAEDENSITVTFKTIDNAASYKLYKAVDEGEYEEVMTELTPEDGIITYVDTELVKGKTYSYKVAALPVSDSYLESEEVTEGIVIPLHVEGVTLDKEAAELFVGGTLTLAEKITPADATIKDITWSTSDEKVAAVENGVVTAKAVGTATITVTAKDGEKTASCVITVKDNLAAPVVSVSKNGTDAVITWKAVANAASYDVYASVDGKTYTKLGNTTALTYTEKSISLSMHYYKVVAKGSGYYVDSKDSNVVSVDNNVVKVTKVSLNKASVTINKGKTSALAATVTPSNATNKAVTWKSSNTKVATVNANGLVKAVGKGTATITVAAADGSGQKATCKVTVKVPATKVTLNTKKVYVVKGKSISLKATMTPSDTTDKITWKSNSKNVTIDKNGKIKAKKTGTVTITATSTSGKKATCKVYVVSKATKSKSVKLNKKTASLKAGNTLTLKATMSPAKSTDTVKWTTSNKKVATVDAFGTVTAKKKGKVTITAKTTSGKKATCKITVK